MAKSTQTKQKKKKSTSTQQQTVYQENWGQIYFEQRMDDDGNELPHIIRITDAMIFDHIGLNRRMYTTAAGLEAYQELVGQIEDGFTGRVGVVDGVAVGENGHPRRWGERDDWTRAAVRWTEASWVDSEQFPEKKSITLVGELTTNAAGMEASQTMASGIMPGVSARSLGLGTFQSINEGGEEIEVEVVHKMRFLAFDLVSTPAFQNQVVILEDVNPNNIPMGDNSLMENELTLEELKEENPVLYQSLMKQLVEEQQQEKQRLLMEAAQEDAQRQQLFAEREATLRGVVEVPEGMDLQEYLEQLRSEADQLRQQAQQRKIKLYVEGIVTQYKEAFGDFYELFVESVQAATSGMLEESAVNDVIQYKRKEYEKMIAQQRTMLQGLARNGHGIQVLGPVVESEWGFPQYLAGAIPLIENIERTEYGIARWNPNKPNTRNRAEIFAASYLKLFAERFQHELEAEWRMFSESNSTADLQLPYTVAFSIIFQAYPQLVAAQVFNFGVANGSPVKVYTESWEGEDGLYVTVTDQDEVFAAADTLVPLGNTYLTPGEETVIYDPAGAALPLVYGLDYFLNYKTGEAQILSTSPQVTGGAITFPATVRFTYTYDTIRNAEGTGISQGKVKITEQEVAMAAMRLASEITHEAIVFSRSNLNYDIVARNIAHQVRVITESIDTVVFYEALNSVFSLPANWPSGTPPQWDSATQTVEDLIIQIGIAKVLLMQRNYMPTSIVTSPMIAEILSNWKLFRDNEQVSLGINGLAGMVKGLPVFSTNLFPRNDDFILIVNQELVYHRVLEPMSIQGPFQEQIPYESVPGSGNFDRLKITDNQFWFAREMNGQFVPLPEKGSFVRIL